MYREKFIKEFESRVNFEELDDVVDPFSFTVGFFMGMKCDLDQAYELADKARGAAGWGGMIKA